MTETTMIRKELHSFIDNMSERSPGTNKERLSAEMAGLRGELAENPQGRMTAWGSR
jgi:hypothetical protein